MTAKKKNIGNMVFQAASAIVELAKATPKVVKLTVEMLRACAAHPLHTMRTFRVDTDIVESLKAHGWSPKYNAAIGTYDLPVFMQTLDGQYQVLCGYGRIGSMRALLESDAEILAKILANCEIRVFPPMADPDALRVINDFDPMRKALTKTQRFILYQQYRAQNVAQSAASKAVGLARSAVFAALESCSDLFRSAWASSLDTDGIRPIPDGKVIDLAATAQGAAGVGCKGYKAAEKDILNTSAAKVVNVKASYKDVTAQARVFCAADGYVTTKNLGALLHAISGQRIGDDGDLIRFAAAGEFVKMVGVTPILDGAHIATEKKAASAKA